MFEFFFNRVREFHPRMRKQLHAVVLKRIVRGGDNHAGLKIILPDKTSYTRSGNHAGEGHGGARMRETSGKQRRDVRTGFACVHADQHMSRAMFAL